MTARRWVSTVSGAGIAAFIMLAALNFIIDPIQYFRQASFYRPYFHGNYCRYINPGMAKNRPYDTVIVGSSFMANTSPAMVNSALHVRSVNLTMFGATSKEIRLILETAIRTGKVKRVIWGLDLETIEGDPDRVAIPDFPYYLYDDSLLNDCRYIINFDLLYRLSREIIALNLGKGGGDFDAAYNWMETKRPFFKRDVVLQDWNRARASGAAGEGSPLTGRIIEQNRRIIRQNLLSVIRANPSIRFDIIYTPHSILFWLEARRTGSLRAIIQMKRDLFRMMKGHGNVHLHDPQADGGMLHDLDQYCDIGHYSDTFNRRFVDALVTGEFIVTGSSNERSISRLIEQIGRGEDEYR
jgi:hypothetical protein